MTNVTAIASTPFTEVACKIAIIFEVCMKFGDAIENPINKMIKLAKARTRWWVPAATIRESVDLGASWVMVVIVVSPRQPSRDRVA